MVALTMIVVSVQAASVDWTTGNMFTLAVNSGQSYTTDWLGQTVGFYLVSSGFDLAGLKSELSVGNQTTLNSLTPDFTGPLGTGPSYRANGTGVKSDFVDGNTAYGFAIVQNKNADYANVNTADFAISELRSGTFGAVGNATIDFLGTTAGGFKTYDVVPEPTSMALLAFGIAAIGLRRRFKK